MPKKTMSKKAAKKAPAKKAVKNVAAEPSPAVKAAPAKKAPAKKGAIKKAPAKKAAATKASAAKKATVVARVDVGFGNSVFIRGEGGGLSWDSGKELKNDSALEWSISLSAGATYKLLLNDELWAEGEDLTVAPGETSITSPVFPQ